MCLFVQCFRHITHNVFASAHLIHHAIFKHESSLAIVQIRENLHSMKSNYFQNKIN